jgi:hypothetical protein
LIKKKGFCATGTLGWVKLITSHTSRRVPAMNIAIPKRLPTRCCLPDNWDDLNEDDQVWAPLAYYQAHQLQQQELIFNPSGDNSDLLNELGTRALAHGVSDPFLITDVLFAGEMRRVWDDYEPVRQRIEHLEREPLERLKESERQAKERHRWAKYGIRWQAETADDHLEQKASLIELLTPETLKSVQSAANDPTELADCIIELFSQAASAKARYRANIKNQSNKSAREEALQLAEELWEQDPDLTKQQVIDHINKELKIECTEETIAKWIVPAVPESRKKGGKPRKKKQ